VGTVQEENDLAGAHTALYGAQPDTAIVVDVTHATDVPDVDERQNGVHPLGSGPVIGRASQLNAEVFEQLYATAEREAITVTVEASGRYTGTDADAMQLTRAGIRTGLVQVPLRYMHSPVEMVCLTDIDNAAKLIAAAARRLTPETSFLR